MNNAWQEIWEKRTPVQSGKTIFSQIELIELNGFDHPGILNFTRWNDWFLQLRKNAYANVDSIYEIGCGSGAFLNYFSDLRIGGCDYSESLLTVARIQFPERHDFEKIAAQDIDIEIKYDNISSFSVFQYLTKDEAYRTLSKMLDKAEKSFFIFDVPLKSIEQECEYFRRNEGMKVSFHTYFKPKFFLDFAFDNDCQVKFEMQNIPSYMHNPYRFNVYFYKNGSN